MEDMLGKLLDLMMRQWVVCASLSQNDDIEVC